MLAVCGWILIADGIVSLGVFRKQSWYCQMVRILRMIIGITLLTVDFYG